MAFQVEEAFSPCTAATALEYIHTLAWPEFVIDLHSAVTSLTDPETGTFVYNRFLLYYVYHMWTLCGVSGEGYPPLWCISITQLSIQSINHEKVRAVCTMLCMYVKWLYSSLYCDAHAWYAYYIYIT